MNNNFSSLITLKYSLFERKVCLNKKRVSDPIARWYSYPVKPMSRAIETAKAIIKDDVQILKHIKKYTLPKSNLDPTSTINHATYVKMTYRRFVRLRPLVSKREMVRETYSSYIRCKYKYEPVGLKMSLVCPGEPSLSQIELREQIYNSLQFILRAVTYNDPMFSDVIKADITFAKQILKNVLTVEYEKLKDDSEKKWQYKENKFANSNVIDFNIEYNHLNTSSKLSKEKENKYAAIRSFDECLMYLNKTLNTNL